MEIPDDTRTQSPGTDPFLGPRGALPGWRPKTPEVAAAVARLSEAHSRAVWALVLLQARQASEAQAQQGSTDED